MRTFLAEEAARTKPQNLAKLRGPGCAGAWALRTEMRGKTLSGEEVDPRYQLGAFISSDLTFTKVIKWKNQKIQRSKGKEMKSSIV